MKRALLAREGIRFDDAGKVARDSIPFHNDKELSVGQADFMLFG
jgi:hypothetical protein